MQRLLGEARRRSLAALHGSVRVDNARMLEPCRELGTTIAPDPGDPDVRDV